MKRASTRIRWHIPTDSNRVHFDRDLVTAEFPESDNTARETLLRVGIPVIEGARTATEYAIGLLQVAAEVEHALMVQYLYAAASAVSIVGDPAKHQRLLNRIAIEEMGHLATVQNLLLLVGGREALHLQRDTLRKNSEENPIPFVLKPVSRPTLAIYVAAEMPARVPTHLQQKVDDLVALAKTTTDLPLHRVGAIYETLKFIFLPPAQGGPLADLFAEAPIPDKPHLSDADLRPSDEVAKYEAGREEWDGPNGFILETPHNTAEAVRAIALISEQGEGFGGAVDTHFERFLSLVDDFDAGSFVARPLATSPNLGTGTGGEEGEPISHPYTRLWGEIFAGQYGLLVLSIYHALRTPREGDAAAAPPRAKMVELAMTGMRSVVTPLTRVLAELPLRPHDPGEIGNPARASGPPFDLDPSLLVPPASEAEMGTRHLDGLDRLADLYVMVEQASDFAEYPLHANALHDLRNYDQERRNLIVVLADQKTA